MPKHVDLRILQRPGDILLLRWLSQLFWVFDFRSELPELLAALHTLAAFCSPCRMPSPVSTRLSRVATASSPNSVKVER